jgi:hypothetical protein
VRRPRKTQYRWEGRHRRSLAFHRDHIHRQPTSIDQLQEAFRWLKQEALHQDKLCPPREGEASHVTEATNRIIAMVIELHRQERQRRQHAAQEEGQP